MKRNTAIFILSTVIASSMIAQDLKYIEYDTDLISGAVYKERRERVMKETGPESVILLYAAPEHMRNNDVEYQYRQDDNFYYLTGFTEPNSVLALVPKGISVPDPDDSAKTLTVTEILFVRAKNPQREHWNGRNYGPAGAMKLRGFQYATTVDRFQQMMGMMMFRGGAKYLYVPPFASDFTGEIAETMQPVQALIDRRPSVELRDPSGLIKKMRAIKSPEEIEMITKASKISALAHKQAMMSCEPGMYEYELQAVYEYVYRKNGMEYNAYPCIVGAAENSVVLHYNTVRRKINNGDIVLTDCGGEYHWYATDITRTFPANGRFSPAQKSIYEIVLAAQKAAIARIKPGASWSDVSAAAAEVVEDGLLKIGIVKQKNNREYRRFFTHGLGHPVGLDVHDVGGSPLEAGMVYTVEPGIYIQEGAAGVSPEYYNIGVRIEDTILVTQNGSNILSADAPREIDEIEKLMKKKGIGNQGLD